MSNVIRVELVWVDCYCDDHTEYFTCHASEVDDFTCHAMERLALLPTFLNFKTLSIFRMEDAYDIVKDDAEEA